MYTVNAFVNLMENSIISYYPFFELQITPEEALKWLVISRIMNLDTTWHIKNWFKTSSVMIHDIKQNFKKEK